MFWIKTCYENEIIPTWISFLCICLTCQEDFFGNGLEEEFFGNGRTSLAKRFRLEKERTIPVALSYRWLSKSTLWRES